MARIPVAVLALGALCTFQSSLPAQTPSAAERGTALFHAPPSHTLSPAAVAVPDSVRRRVGYQHWKGAAIGGGLGAFGGLALALAAHGQCADCTSASPNVALVTLAGAGLGGTFGFLVGLASPRYRWVRAGS